MDDGEQSVEELLANLAEYKSQREAVEELLSAEPGNEEYVEMASSLNEVIQMTEELLGSVTNAQQAIPPPFPPVSAPVGFPAASGPSDLEASRNTLHAHFSQFQVGSKVQAVFSEDGQWYDATVEGVTAEGYAVTFDAYGNKEEVTSMHIRPRIEETDLYTGVAAPKRMKVEEKILPKELPKSIVIGEEDDENTKERKRKQIKAYKSRQRMQQKDLEQTERQNNWQGFLAGKGKKKKVGFFTGRKKDSMFKSPDSIDGRVGVTGSGKGMTDFKDRLRQDRGGAWDGD